MTSIDKLGERIHHIRKIMGLTQTELAQKLGFERAITVSRYEKSHREPELSVLVKIAELGEVKLDWLLTGEGQKDKIKFTYNTEPQDIKDDLEISEPEGTPYDAWPELTRLKSQLARIYKVGDDKTRGKIQGFLAALDLGEEGAVIIKKNTG